MKCAIRNCTKEAPDGRLFCCHGCAQMGRANPHAVEDFLSDPATSGFFTAGPGDLSPRSSAEEMSSASVSEPEGEKAESGRLSHGKASPFGSESISVSDKPNEGDRSVSSTEQPGMHGMSETEKNRTEKRSSGESGATLPGASSRQLINLDEARSVSMSLLDETATHCLDYMKSIGKDCQSDRTLTDFRKINAVANLATQVASLAKVKLDAIKEARKVGAGG